MPTLPSAGRPRGVPPQAPGATARRGIVAEASTTPTARAASCGTLSGWLTPHLRLLDQTRMPRTKAFAANAGSAELNAMIECVAPDVLELLADGVSRTKAAIVEALAGRHERQ